MFDYKLLFRHKRVRLKLLNCLKFIPDKVLLKLEYKIRTGKTLNLMNPQTYTEKLQWLKLYDRKSEYTTMVDKIAMKDYVSNILGEGYTVPLLGTWDSFDEIDFNALPNRFVMKCSHDSGSVILCEDKSSFDYESARKKLSFHLSIDEYALGREWPYKNVPRKIIAEEYLTESCEKNASSIKDYKFFCFNGVPKIMYVSNDRGTNPKTDFFDMEYNHLPLRMKDPNDDVTPEKPESFLTMKNIAEKLSVGIPHLRVDFYVIDGRVLVGELTFFHNSGFTLIKPDEWNLKMGEWIVLPKKDE